MPKKRAQQNPPQVQPIQEKKVNLTDISPALSDNCRVFFNEISKLNLPIQCPAVSDAMSKTIISMQESIRNGQHISPTVFDMELSRNVLDVLGEIGSSVDKSQSAFLAAFSRYSAETLNSYGEQIHNFLQLVPEMQGVSPQVVSDLRQLERTITTSNYAIGDLFQSVNSVSGKASLNPALFEAAQKAAVEVRNKTVDMVVHSGSELSQTAMVLARKARESLSEYTAQYDIVRELDRELEQTRRLPSSSERDLKISELSQRIILLKKTIEKGKRIQQDQEWRNRQNTKILCVQNGCQILDSITDIASMSVSWYFSSDGKKLSEEEKKALEKKKAFYGHVIKGVRVGITVASSSATIAYSIVNWGALAAASGPLAPLVGIVGAAKIIAGLFFPAEPTDREIFQQYFQQLSEQISVLNENMNRGFQIVYQGMTQLDECSRQRFQVLAQMLEQMNANILRQLTDVKQSVEQTRENLNRIAIQFSSQLQAFQEETQVQLRDLYDQDFINIKRQARLFVGTGDESKVNKFFSRFCTRAVEEAGSEMLAGSSSARVFDERLWQRAAEFNINPLFAYARSILALTMPAGILQDPHFRLINPLIWEEAVTSMLSFVYCTPSFMLCPERRREIEGLISAGQSAQEFIMVLKTHPELFQKLFQFYRSSLEKVSEALVQCVSDHLSIDEVKKAMEEKVKETWPLHQKLRKREAKLAQKKQELEQIQKQLQEKKESSSEKSKSTESSSMDATSAVIGCAALVGIGLIGAVIGSVPLASASARAMRSLTERNAPGTEQLREEVAHREEQVAQVREAVLQEPAQNPVEMVEEYFEKFIDHDPEPRSQYAAKVLEQESTVTSQLHYALAQLEENYHLLLSFVALAFKEDEGLQTAVRTQLWDRLTFKKYMDAYRAYKLGGEDSAHQDSIYTYLHKHFLKTLDDLQQLVMERAAAMYLATRVGDFVPSHPSIDATLEKLDVFLQLFSLKSKTPLQCLESQKAREQARGARHWYFMSFFTSRGSQQGTFRRVGESDALALLQLPAKRSVSESPPRLQDTPHREMSDGERQSKRSRREEDFSLPIAVQQPDQQSSGVFPAAVVKSPAAPRGII